MQGNYRDKKAVTAYRNTVSIGRKQFAVRKSFVSALNSNFSISLLYFNCSLLLLFQLTRFYDVRRLFLAVVLVDMDRLDPPRLPFVFPPPFGCGCRGARCCVGFEFNP